MKFSTTCKDCGYKMLLCPEDDPTGDWRCMPCGFDHLAGRPSRRAITVANRKDQT